MVRKRSRCIGTAFGPSAFTLIEVILAMAITLGMLAVVLFFYQQSATLRTQLLEETARVSSARLIMDRLALELGTAQRCELRNSGLTGGSNTIEFCRLEYAPASASQQTNPPPAVPAFHQISYETLLGTNGSGGMIRRDQPVGTPALQPQATEGTPAEAVVIGGNSIPIADLQYASFRYWNGADWQAAWTAPELPAAVEVTLGAEPLPEGLSAEEYPFELYRRVIFLANRQASLAPPPGAPSQEETP